MIEELRKELFKLSDLTIREATFEDILLQIRGRDWSLTSDSPWRVVHHGVFVCGSGQRAAPDLIRRLRGKSIERVVPQSAFMRGDPAFELSGGEFLELFSDQGVDPWTLHLPNMIFVGNAQD